MTKKQKAEYKQYRAECKINGVLPLRDDFLGIERSVEEIDAMITREYQKYNQRPRARSAAAGR
jgi:hypothetical protein